MTARHLPVAGEQSPEPLLGQCNQGDGFLELDTVPTNPVAFGYEIIAQAIARTWRQPVLHNALVLPVEGLYRKVCQCGWISIGSGTSGEAWNACCERLELERLIEGRILRDGTSVIDALRSAARAARPSQTSAALHSPPNGVGHVR